MTTDEGFGMISHIPNILSADLVVQVRQRLLAGTFEDGRYTATGRAAEVKNNMQLGNDPLTRKVVDEIVTRAVMSNPRFAELAFPKGMVPPTYNRYDVGMTYGDHVDAPFLNNGRVRADLSMTIFLTDPATYDGGDLVIRDGLGEIRIKHDAGDAVLYPTTSLHHVTPVTRGSRLSAVTWIQSYVRDPAQRELLYELDLAREHLLEHADGEPTTGLVDKSYANLLRMWSDV